MAVEAPVTQHPISVGTIPRCPLRKPRQRQTSEEGWRAAQLLEIDHSDRIFVASPRIEVPQISDQFFTCAESFITCILIRQLSKTPARIYLCNPHWNVAAPVCNNYLVRRNGGDAQADSALLSARSQQHHVSRANLYLATVCVLPIIQGYTSPTSVQTSAYPSGKGWRQRIIVFPQTSGEPPKVGPHREAQSPLERMLLRPQPLVARPH